MSAPAVASFRRDNPSWLRELAAGGSRREAAVGELRRLLVRGLGRSLGSQKGVDRGLVEDVVQESILKILSRLHTFEGRSRFETWAMAIAIHSALTALRKRRWSEVSLDSLLEAGAVDREAVSEPSSGPHQTAERQAMVEALERAIAEQLTERQRAALRAELRGMPQEEIGRRIGSNRNAVYKLLHDARKKLKSALERAGYTVDHVRSAFSDG